MDNLPIIVFTAPSGGGKNHVIRHLLKEHGGTLSHCISDASRPPREDESPGNPYNFLDPLEFILRALRKAYIEYANVNEENRADDYGWRGTPKSEISRIWGEGKIPLLDLNPDGAIAVEEMYGERVRIIVLEPPETLRIRRLRERDAKGGHSRTELERRIRTGAEELRRAKEGLKRRSVIRYDYTDLSLNFIENMVVGWIQPFAPVPFAPK